MVGYVSGVYMAIGAKIVFSRSDFSVANRCGSDSRLLCSRLPRFCCESRVYYRGAGANNVFSSIDVGDIDSVAVVVTRMPSRNGCADSILVIRRICVLV